MKLSVFNKSDTLVYIIKGSIFQTGVWTKGDCPCKKCQIATLFVYDLNGEKVGIIEKRGKGFIEMFSDADNYSLLFPIKANLEERALLLSATLFLDYLYFESNSQRNNSSRYSYSAY